MKSFLCLLLLLVSLSVSQAQTRPTAGRIMGGSAIPTGSCNSSSTLTDIYIRTGVPTANAIYLCNSGGWVLFEGGGAPVWGDITGVLGEQSDLQTALAAKAPAANPTFTGTVVVPTPFTLGAVPVLPTGTELNFVDGVTSAIQTQLDAKQATLTNSAGLRSALSDETGTDLAVFSNTPTLTAPNIGAATGTSLVASGSVTAASFVGSGTGAAFINFCEPTGTGSDCVEVEAPSSVTATYKIKWPAAVGTGFLRHDGTNQLSFVAETGSSSVVRATSPTLVTPTLGAALATSINGLTITTSTGTLTIPNGVTLTGPAASGTAATLAGTETLSNKVLVSAAANPADAGVVRLGNTEIIGWEAATPGTDITIAVNPSDEVAISATLAVGTSPDVTLGRAAADVATLPWLRMTSGRCFLAADQTNATTTMANMTGCSIQVTSGFKYTFKGIFYLNDSVAADGAKIDFDGGAATMTNFRCHCTAFDTALNLSSQSSALATDFAATTFTGAGMFECHGTMEPSSTSTFIPRIAQNAHTTGTLTLARGSYLLVEDMP